jgi:hypothetical protein
MDPFSTQAADPKEEVISVLAGSVCVALIVAPSLFEKLRENA